MKTTKSYLALNTISFFFKVVGFLVILSSIWLTIVLSNSNSPIISDNWSVFFVYIGLFTIIVAIPYFAFSEIIILFVNLSLNSDKQLSSLKEINDSIKTIANAEQDINNSGHSDTVEE